MSFNDQFSDTVKRGKVGRPGKNRPEARQGYDVAKRRSAGNRAKGSDEAAAADQPDTRYSNGVLRRRVGRK